MVYRGKVLITDEAIEVYKKLNLFSAWKVEADWDREKQSLKIKCEPSDLSFSWPWQGINKLLKLGDVMPLSAIAVRDRDAIALIFYANEEDDLHKSRLVNGDIYNIGILTSDGFLKLHD